MLEVPINRITTLNDDQPNMDAPYVLYWMIAFRRVNYNFSLQRAIESVSYTHLRAHETN